MQNHAYIRQLVQELMKCYFQSSAGDTCCLLFMNQGLTNSVHSVPQANLFQFGIIVCQFILVRTKKFQSLCIHIGLFPHCISLFVNSVSLVFIVFYNTPHNCFVLRNVFHIRDKKILMLPCIKLCVTVILLRCGFRTLRTYKM